MTPLAHEIVKDSLLPVKQRRHKEVADMLRLREGVHFFECSAIADLAEPLVTSSNFLRVRERLGFLPAPRTWMEIACPGQATVRRMALLLEQDGEHQASVSMIGLAVTGEIVVMCAGVELPLWGSLEAGEVGGTTVWGPPNLQLGDLARTAHMIYGLLAMINTPRVIMRRQHMPHRGLERQLVAQRGNVGKWPLQGWSELVLKVRPPNIDDTDHEAHLTGARALHFCRAHLRIRLGRLELVSAHWRGDAVLGIKQTRYRLAA
jgi:hypothetical protein